jgi:catechol 2,3-dioxygenase-like lactoylglutathione lyase family enzyme
MALAHITLATRNVRQSTEFFASTLGWMPVDRPNNIPMQAAWLAIAPDQELHLLEVKEFEPSPFEREFGRHIAVSFPKADFPKLRDRLARAGAELIDPLRPTEFERFFFRDPNGYIFEVVPAER